MFEIKIRKLNKSKFYLNYTEIELVYGKIR